MDDHRTDMLYYSRRARDARAMAAVAADPSAQRAHLGLALLYDGAIAAIGTSARISLADARVL